MNKIVGMDSEDFLLFSRNGPLHLLLDVLSVNDEEDESLSSKLRIQREYFTGSISNPIPPIHGDNS